MERRNMDKDKFNKAIELNNKIEEYKDHKMALENSNIKRSKPFQVKKAFSPSIKSLGFIEVPNNTTIDPKIIPTGI